MNERNTKYPLHFPMPKDIRYQRYSSELIAKQVRGRFDAAKSRAKAEAADKVFLLNGRKMNRYDMMEHVVNMIYSGYSIPRIIDECADPESIMPTGQEIASWYKWHPDFKTGVDEAEKYRAEVLADRALGVVMGLMTDSKEPTRNQIASAKLVKETLMEQASALSEKYSPKTRQQIEDVTERLRPEEVKARIEARLEENPELREVMKRFMEAKQQEQVQQEHIDVELIQGEDDDSVANEA